MSVIPSKERLSQKGCHKTVTEEKRALVAKDKNRQEAESTALSCPLLPPQKSWSPHPGPLLRLHSCSTVFGYPHSPATNSPAALWNVSSGKPLNFPSTSLWKLAFLNVAPTPLSSLETGQTVPHRLVPAACFFQGPFHCHTLALIGSLIHEPLLHQSLLSTAYQLSWMLIWVHSHLEIVLSH